MPPQVPGNVPNLSLPSTGTGVGVMVGVIGAGVCPGASEEDDAALLHPPAKAATAVVEAVRAAVLAAATPKARSFPTPMEPLTPPPPPTWPPPAWARRPGPAPARHPSAWLPPVAGRPMQSLSN